MTTTADNHHHTSSDTMSGTGKYPPMSDEDRAAGLPYVIQQGSQRMVYILPDTKMICGLCGLAMYRFTTLSNHYRPRTKEDGDITCKEYGKWEREMSIWNKVEVSCSCA